MKIISGSQYSSFHDYLKKMFCGYPEIEVLQTQYKDITDVVTINQSAIIILDAHSHGSMQACSGLSLLNELRSKNLNLPVIMLCWFTRAYLLLHTQQNSTNNRWLNILYRDTYRFCQLPVDQEELLQLTKTLKPFVT